MKDSGVEWIGNIPKNWNIGRIGELYTERNQKVSDIDFLPLSVTMQGILPQLANVAKTDAHDDRKLVKKDDFVINSRSDRRGSCGIADRDGSVSLINTVLNPRNEMNPQYYSWLFHSSMFADEFYKWGHGIVDDLWTTRWADMKQIAVPCPSLIEQQQIASFLDSKCSAIDDVVTKTQESIEEYKKLKQAVITEAVTKGVRGKRPMKDSGIDWIEKIPSEWNIVKIKKVMYDVNQQSRAQEEQLSVTQDRGIIKSSEAKIANPSLNTEGWKLVQPDDIVFNKYKAHSGVFFVSQFRGIVTFNYSVYRCYENNYPAFLEYLYKSSGCISEFIKSMKGVGESISPLYTKDLFQIYISQPSYKEQREIADYLDKKCAAIDSLIEKKQQFIEELTAYKKSLIYEYVTGKKEVPA